MGAARTTAAILATVLGLLGLGTASHAQQQVNLSNMPASSVVGRLGSGVAGAAQSISFATLLAQLNSVTGFVTGPTNTVSGNIVTWNSTNGMVAGTYAGATCASSAVTAISAAGAVTCTAKAATQTNVASPAGPNSTSTVKMQGLAGTITPAVSGNVLITISGTIIETGITAAGSGITYQISYGTGSAPSTNGTLAGTQAASGIQKYLLAQTVTAADVFVPFSTSFVVTGLTIGTAYWIDLAAEAVANTGFSLSNVSVSAAEI